MGNELYHHGVKGQHWGIRRFQNKDGSLTEAGRSRYRTGEPQKKSSLTIKKNPITSSKSKSAPAKKEDPAKTKEQYDHIFQGLLFKYDDVLRICLFVYIVIVPLNFDFK